MSIVINFAERTGIQFGAGRDEKKGSTHDAWHGLVVLAPMLRRRLEKAFGLPVKITQEAGQFTASLDDSIEIVHPRRSDVYAAGSNTQLKEENAIAQLYYRVTSQLAREQAYLRQSFADGSVKHYKFDCLRETFYPAEMDRTNVHALHVSS